MYLCASAASVLMNRAFGSIFGTTLMPDCITKMPSSFPSKGSDVFRMKGRRAELASSISRLSGGMNAT
jgi:hypothetical protein